MWKRYRRQATLFALMTLSALLYWFENQNAVSRHGADPSAASRQHPEWITYDAKIWMAASDAPKNSHYLKVLGASYWPQSRRTELSLPVGWVVRPDQLLYWQGQQGRIQSDRLFLDHDVRLALFVPRRPPLYLLTEHLRYDVAEKQLSAPEEAKIKQGNSLLTGKFLQYWLDAQRLRINEEVRARYEKTSS